MLARVITGVIGVPIAALLVFYPRGLPFAIAIGIVSVLGAMEFYGGLRKTGARPVHWAGLAAIVLFVASARTYERATIASVFPAVLTLLLISSFAVELIRKNRSPLINVGSTLFGAMYVGWLISHLVVLRGFKGEVTVGSFQAEAGAWLVMLTFLCTWACDTGAFTFGKLWGKTKLAPMLSPNKTIEGALGGFVSSVVIAVIVGLIIKLPLHHSLALGAMFGVFSQMGDLSESAIKRELGIKDFGTIVPGHGGILDRFDSLLFSGPVAYYYIELFIHHWPK